MEVDKEVFKRMFPNLYREIEEGKYKVTINSVRTEESYSKELNGYDPDVIDFLRRCDTEEQAEEIIEYMRKQGEINGEYAERLQKQLKEKGIRSFGSKKEDDYYFKLAEKMKKRNR